MTDTASESAAQDDDQQRGLDAVDEQLIGPAGRPGPRERVRVRAHV